MKKVIKDLEFAQEIEKIEGFEVTIETNQQPPCGLPDPSGGSSDNDEDATSDTD